VLGEGGYLTGADAEAAACDAMIVPLVTGTVDATARWERPTNLTRQVLAVALKKV
jgi:hypothetical protein